MKNLSSVESKLRLLGEDLIVLSEDAIISTSVNKSKVCCYGIQDKRLLVKEYDEIRPRDIENDTKYIVGIDGDNSHILDRKLIIQSKFYKEQIREILENKYVVVTNPIGQCYRVTTIKGLNITDIGKVIYSVSIWKQDDEKYIISAILANRNKEIICVENDSIKARIEAGNDTGVYAAKDIIIIKDYSDNVVKVYDTNGKVVIVVRGGGIKKEASIKGTRNFITILSRYGEKIAMYERLIDIY